MIKLKDTNSKREIQVVLGQGYGWSNKLQLKGTGSCKMIYVSGIDFFNAIQKRSQDLDYFRVELYPGGLVGRYNKTGATIGVIIKKDQLEEACFRSRKIIIRTKNGQRLVLMRKLI